MKPVFHFPFSINFKNNLQNYCVLTFKNALLKTLVFVALVFLFAVQSKAQEQQINTVTDGVAKFYHPNGKLSSEKTLSENLIDSDR